MCLAVSRGNGWWRCWPCQNDTQGTWRRGWTPLFASPHPLLFLLVCINKPLRPLSLFIHPKHFNLSSSTGLLNWFWYFSVFPTWPFSWKITLPKKHLVLFLWINSAQVGQCGRNSWNKSWPIKSLLLPLPLIKLCTMARWQFCDEESSVELIHFSQKKTDFCVHNFQ